MQVLENNNKERHTADQGPGRAETRLKQQTRGDGLLPFTFTPEHTSPTDCRPSAMRDGLIGRASLRYVQQQDVRSDV